MPAKPFYERLQDHLAEFVDRPITPRLLIEVAQAVVNLALEDTIARQHRFEIRDAGTVFEGVYHPFAIEPRA